MFFCFQSIRRENLKYNALNSKKCLGKFTQRLQESKIAGKITCKITCINDTCSLPRKRFLEFTCKLKQQYYISYVDFDVKKLSKSLIEVYNNILKWTIRMIQSNSEQKTGKFQRKLLRPIPHVSKLVSTN